MTGRPPLSRRAFARRLRHLSREEFAAFVADLWEHRGWTTTVVDGHVVVERDGDQRRLHVYRERRVRSDDAPPVGPAVDAVVTTGGDSGPAADRAAALGADLLTVDDLYDMAMYAIGRKQAKGLLWEYVGGTGPGRQLWHGPLRTGTVGRVGALAVALLVVVAIAAVTTGLLSGSEGGVSGTTVTPADEPVFGAASTTTASGRATGSASATAGGAVTTTGTPSRGTGPVGPAACERGPNEVVSAVVGLYRASDATANDSLTDAWQFLSPQARASFGEFEAFVDAVDSPQYAPLVTATNTTFGPIRQFDGTAVQRVTVSSPAGNVTYEFTASRAGTTRGEDCWRVDMPRQV